MNDFRKASREVVFNRAGVYQPNRLVQLDPENERIADRLLADVTDQIGQLIEEGVIEFDQTFGDLLEPDEEITIFRSSNERFDVVAQGPCTDRNGQYKPFFIGGSYAPTRHHMEIEVNPCRTAAEWVDPELYNQRRDSLLQVFMHEMTHAEDPGVRFGIERMRRGETVGYLPAPGRVLGAGLTPAEYVNMPSEVKAFGREVYMEVARSIENLLTGRNNSPMIAEAFQQHMRKRSGKRGAGEVVEAFVAISKSWSDIRKAGLTPENQRRILRDVYQQLDADGWLERLEAMLHEATPNGRRGVPDDVDFLIRVGTRPQSDLRRGYSYSMGEFGNESEAHDGLSGYSLTSRGIVSAVAKLDDRMGIYSSEATDELVTLFAGYVRGTGPDMEELFHPVAIVKSWGKAELGSSRVSAIFKLSDLIVAELKKLGRGRPRIAQLAQDFAEDVEEMRSEFADDLTPNAPLTGFDLFDVEDEPEVSVTPKAAYEQAVGAPASRQPAHTLLRASKLPPWLARAVEEGLYVGTSPTGQGAAFALSWFVDLPLGAKANNTTARALRGALIPRRDLPASEYALHKAPLYLFDHEAGQVERFEAP